ncbi:MAG: hypothetical protein NTW65_05625 [Deltaproteobacteria bacterium]|nr:hypothetical protein [Deltaproteobacteria bacterium]
MKKNIITVIALLFCGLLLAGNVNAAGGWTKIKESSGIKLYERSVPGTDLMEYIAVTTIDAKMEVIGEVLRDIPQYPKWVADCASTRLEKKYDRNTFVLYLILDPPFIEKRDIILKDEAVYDYDNGNAKINFFSTDEVKIPIDKNRTRVTVMNGLFQMEYLGRSKTKFIYKLKTDPAGNIPKKVAYAVMKNYPYNTLKKLKEFVKDSKKYSDIAKGTEEETQINARSVNEASVKKIFGDTLMRVVKDKATMAAIIAADSEGIKNIAASGGAYTTVEKTATDAFLKYIDKTLADKKIAESLKNNKKLVAEITELVQTDSEANDETVDSIVARYYR